MANKGSHFADFVRFRPHTYTRTQQSLPHLWAAINTLKNAQLLNLSICSQLYHHIEPQLVNLSYKSNKLFPYERNINWK